MASQPQIDRVKVNVRPLITPELLLGCTDCVTVTPGEPQINTDPVTAEMHLDDIGSGCEVGTLQVSSEVDEEEKEREHSSTQEKLDMELQHLDKRLEQKEAEMKQFDTVCKQHYETKLDEMVQEKRALQKEIVDLRHAIPNTSNSTDEWSNYLEKLNMIETQVSQLEKKQEAHEQLLRHKQKSDDEAMRLQGEIQRIKSQKVQLEEKMKQESEQFRSWKAAREMEVLEQLKKEGGWNEYEMHKLLALNQKQKMDVDLMKTHISKIQQLEAEVTRRKFSTACSNGLHDGLALDKGMHLDDIGSGCQVGTLEVSSEVDEEEKEREHSSTQEKLDMELQDLDKRLEQKEAEMKQFDTVRKQHYETKLDEMVQEKRALQKEIVDLRHAIGNTSNSTDEWSNYLDKLNMIETQVSQAEKKQEAHEQLLRHKQKSDDEAMRLQGEIQRIKSQKVQLQEKMKQESEQFRSWKAAREMEVLEQLKKEGRGNEYEMHKLVALNQKQKMAHQKQNKGHTLRKA